MKILIIEDDAGICELMRESLEDIGYETYCVESFDEADVFLENEQPFLMIVDYWVTANENAQEWITQRKNRDQLIPAFIVSTGQGDERIAVEMMKLGARDYLIKDSMLMGRLPEIIRRVRQEIESDLKLKNARQLIDKQQRLRELLMEISTSFINLPLDEVDSAVRQSLNNLSSFVQAEKSYVFFYNYDQATASCIYEWSIDGCTELCQALNNISISPFIRKGRATGKAIDVQLAETINDRIIKMIPDVKAFKSVFSIPLLDDKYCIGYINFATTQKGHNYSVSEQNLLKVFSQLLVNIHKRQLSEQSLRQSEEKYRLLFANNPQPMCIIDAATLAFLEVNTATVEHYGYSREEFLSMDLSKIKPVKDNHSLKTNVEKLLASNRVSITSKHLLKNGKIIDVELTSVTTTWNGRQALHILVTGVTEKKQAQQMLVESSEVLHKVLQESILFIDSNVEVDFVRLSDTMQHISGAFCVAFNLHENDGLHYKTKSLSGLNDIVSLSKKWLGFNVFDKEWPVEQVGRDTIIQSIATYKSLTEYASREISPVIVKLIEKTFQLGQIAVVAIRRGDEMLGDFVLLYKKGDIVKHKEILELYANQVGQYLVRKQVEDQIAVSEKKYRFLFANNPQPMWIFDEDTLEILEVNDMAIQHYGYSREEFLSMTINDIRPPDDVPLMKSLLVNKNAVIDEYDGWRHIKKNGEIIYVDIRFRHVDFEGRKARHVLVNDITKRRIAEDALKQKMDELIRFQNVSVDRELTMIELKKEINQLLNESGLPGKYRIVG